MPVAITKDNAGSAVRNAICAATSEIPDASLYAMEKEKSEFLEELEKAYNRLWDNLLTSYALAGRIRDMSPLPFLIDPHGDMVSELESAEQRFRTTLESLPPLGDYLERAVEVNKAAIDILQTLRWEIMINDGIAEKGDGEYLDADSFMASMGL